VPDGCVIRELPDGGREFVLEDPVLACIQVDAACRLRFGLTDVAVGSQFSVEIDGIGHRLDPRRTGELGPLLALYPGTARWLWASPEGMLTLVFENGSRLTVVPEVIAPAWSVGAMSWPPVRQT
jgi:hypothetical protein